MNPSPPPAPSEEELSAKANSWRMFDRIARTYDRLNGILSFGIDRRWRRKLARHLPDNPTHLDLLDLATGTGDQIFTLHRTAPTRWKSLTGTDLSEKMLNEARRKAPERLGDVPAVWRTASAEDLPFPDASFDVATMSFGIRNVPNPVRALREIHRVLRPGGRALILEFSLPRCVLLRIPYLFYFRHVLPWIGGKISGDPGAYRYLNRTVEAFPYEADFVELMGQAGFAQPSFIRLSGGIACLYQGDVGNSEPALHAGDAP